MDSEDRLNSDAIQHQLEQARRTREEMRRRRDELVRQIIEIEQRLEQLQSGLAGNDAVKRGAEGR